MENGRRVRREVPRGREVVTGRTREKQRKEDNKDEGARATSAVLVQVSKHSSNKQSLLASERSCVAVRLSPVSVRKGRQSSGHSLLWREENTQQEA
eukprot:244447-Hanusia_phi.AAC.1